MKAISLVGVLLIVVGVLALAYQGINYTRQKKVLDVGSVHLTTETHERIPLPPILGGLALAGGSSCLSSVQGTSHSPGYGSGLDARKPAQLASIGPPRRARSLVFLIFSAMQRWIIKYFLQARPFQHAGFDIYMPIFC